ncbi:MAG: tyrosine--tRNA ligase, partial [Bacteroidales bacterium]|nr:tyrosine--tRNA ligase [Bacteroidales bacterium]
EITCMVHSPEAYESAVAAAQMLFGAGTAEQLAGMDEETFLSVFEGVPHYEVPASLAEDGLPIIDLLSVHTAISPSKGESRRTIEGGGLYINKERIADIAAVVRKDDLIRGKYLLIQKGKKNYSVITFKNQ